MIPKELKDLICLGYGNDARADVHPYLGQGVWHFRDSTIELILYERGLAYGTNGTPLECLVYRDITGVASALTVQRLSQSAAAFSPEERLPLTLSGPKGFDLSVPIPIYSSVLRGICSLLDRT